MRHIDCGTTGEPLEPSSVDWQDLDLDPLWLAVIGILTPDTKPRPIQIEALGKLAVLAGRRNLIVSAPTNSGKTLIGLLVLLDAIRRGQRAVLLEPLRAVAREKWEELQTASASLERALGRRLRVRISTGDYRIEDEYFADPLPEQGELLIATPERLDAVLRNPSHDPWFGTLGAVVVDEAHLIGDAQRGATLEYLLTTLLCLPYSPRIALLSASMGDLSAVSKWLSPCDVASSSVRVPPLRREVWELGGENAEEAIIRYAEKALAKRDGQLLVFVYQTRSAEALADRLRTVLGERAGSVGPMAYHSQMPQTRREEVRRSFLAGDCRVVVATTALALGINLPATHVCVRDILFPGAGYLPVSDILQMMGRAGRGNRHGHAVVLVHKTEGQSADDLAAGIRDGVLPELRSSLDPVRIGRSRRNEEEPGANCASPVLARLVRHAEDGLAHWELRDFFGRTLGGQVIASKVVSALDWLTDPRRVLAYEDEQHRFRPTALGLRAARAVLPLKVAAGLAQLIRDLLSLDADDALLASWQPLDHLLSLELTHPHAGLGVRFSERLAAKIDAWMADHSATVPRLYRVWLAGPSEPSRAGQILGSLDVPHEDRKTPQTARKTAYLALLRCVVLTERGNGMSEVDLAERWGLDHFAGVEERWRDDHLWLLSGWRAILEVRCFYYHLKETCRVDAARLRRVDAALRRMRHLTFDLQEQLKYCSPLGPLLRDLRQAAKPAGAATVGIATIRRLEGAGIRDLPALAECTLADLRDLGVTQPWASQILRYVRKRLQ